MDFLIAAAEKDGVIGLIDTFYENPIVQGFALGIHPQFISMFRGEFGRDFSPNGIIKDGRIPQSWAPACEAAGFTFTLSPIYVVIYVSISEDEFKSTNKVPKTVMPNHAVFVETITPFVGIADRRRHRPIQGGISVGSIADPTRAGTLGGFIEDSKTGDVYILSCNHVLLACGQEVVQQGPSDGGSWPADTVGMTSYLVPLQHPTGFSSRDPFNIVDTGIAKVNKRINVDKPIRQLGQVTNILQTSDIDLDNNVVFVGKESDLQEAFIYHTIARMKVKINNIIYHFGNVFEIRPRKKQYIGSFAKSGDSGSWVIRENSTYELCGLLFAQNQSGGLCCFIEEVIMALEKESGLILKLH